MHRAEIIDQNVSIIRSLTINTRKYRLDDSQPIKRIFLEHRNFDIIISRLSNLFSKIGIVFFSIQSYYEKIQKFNPKIVSKKKMN